MTIYHLNLVSHILLVIRATPTNFLMTSFLFLSFNKTPTIHCSILISVFSSNPSSLLFTVQASAPPISTGLVIVLCIFLLALFTQNTC